ncbi:MAG: lipoprotein [Methylococcales bacterium]|nr:lipoprotein [Methylococcales bacterium]MCK5924359.1 lipoprotein [Methylococcales bacterium]
MLVNCYKCTKFLILLFLVLGLVGCGQEGPLYMPTVTPPITEAPIKKIIKADPVEPQTIGVPTKTPPDLIKE